MMIPRIYTETLSSHFRIEGNMAMMAGPRQSGKTTTARMYSPTGAHYFNWDDPDDRLILRSAPARLVARVGEDPAVKKVLILDEIHKNPKWRGWLKGFYDKHGSSFEVLITGSARLAVFRRGGDSLLGRYYYYRHHPLSAGEIGTGRFRGKQFRDPGIPADVMDSLFRFGGFPHPFVAAREDSHRKWLRTRRELILHEDLRDLSRVDDIAGIELLMKLLGGRASGLLNYSNLAGDINCSVDSVRRWVRLLEALYYVYLVPPYSGRISRSLRRMPKAFLWDWSEVPDEGNRFENMIASHLLKSVHYWTDTGLGDYELYYVRDKEKREVDFLVLENGMPFLLVEAKRSDRTVSRSLIHYNAILKPRYCLQVVMDVETTGSSIEESENCGVLSATDFCGSLV